MDSLTRRYDILPGGKGIWQVTGADRDALVAGLFKDWGLPPPNPGNERFPGATCVSIERKDFLDLQTQVYYVCEKTDGNRYLMYCTTLADKNYCTLVNRNMEVFLLGIHVPRSFYHGTLLDGEMAVNKKTGATQYLVFDAIKVAGRQVKDLSFDLRLKNIIDETAQYAQPPQDGVGLKIKHFFALDEFAAFEEHYKKAAEYFEMDGLIFTPNAMPVVVGRHRKQYKWKSGDHHTVDFLVQENQPGRLSIAVYDNLNKKHKVVQMLPAGTTVEGQDIKAGMVVECAIVKNAWNPVRLRKDKSHANDIETWKKTIHNIKENILFEEFGKIMQVKS